MTKSTVEPSKSKISKFRVPIQQPERWKIESIAAHKKRIAIVQFKKAEILAAKAKKVHTDEKIEPVAPLVPKAIISDDQIRRELEILQNNSVVVRNKMLALSSIRHSVLWLLKKATLVERAIVS